MTSSAPAMLRRSPLDDIHDAAGARMVPFAGWRMPVQYGGVLAEHHAVRTSAGIFDVSHMGQFVVRGESAHASLQRVLGNSLDRLADVGHAQYTLLLNDAGGIEDDLIAYRREHGEYLLVVNASRREHDLAWLRREVDAGCIVEDVSDSWAMLALQGPAALGVLADAYVDLLDTPAFRSVDVVLEGERCIVATTGYTGEQGCEMLVPTAAAAAVWTRITSDPRVTPCGLAARDTLRLEACFPLHGNDITPETDAVSAGLGWTIGWDTPQFTGAEALRAVRDAGPARRLVPLRAEGRGIPRAGCAVHVPSGEVIGTVSSGTMSPTLGVGIALAWIEAEHASVDSGVTIDVRGRRVQAIVSRRPFHRDPPPPPAR